jgi:salicylate hydroxylase
MKIAVIGAGISGLTFSAALKRYAPGIQVELYERDPNADSRFQGYSLGLKGDGGLQILKSLGLYDQLSQQAVIIKSFVFCDQSGRVLLELPATGDEKRLTQRVRRKDLKTVLVGAGNDATIHSGMPATGFRQNNGEVEVKFENDKTASADYLVACDGGNSAIRKQMFADQKHYLDLTTILVDSPHLINHPLLEGGYFMTLGRNGTSAFCFRQSDGVHLSYTVHAASESEISGLSAGTLLRLVQHETLTWHEPIPEIAAGVDPSSVVVRGYYDKEPLKQARQGRVWLIGDAAHPMSPSQGQGANMAMVDAFKLEKLFCELAADPSNEEAKADALQRDIVNRGRKAILESRTAAQRLHITSHLGQRYRNIGFKISNNFIRMMMRK